MRAEKREPLRIFFGFFLVDFDLIRGSKTLAFAFIGGEKSFLLSLEM